jgi:hypothetical protein
MCVHQHTAGSLRLLVVGVSLCALVLVCIAGNCLALALFGGRGLLVVVGGHGEWWVQGIVELAQAAKQVLSAAGEAGRSEGVGSGVGVREGMSDTSDRAQTWWGMGDGRGRRSDGVGCSSVSVVLLHHSPALGTAPADPS